MDVCNKSRGYQKSLQVIFANNCKTEHPFNVLSHVPPPPRQVETSLQSSFQPGMKLEVANKSSGDTYWVATIITTCGQLLLLRYSGYGDDRKADFWCDIMTAELHPVGWCAQNNKTLMPPEGRRRNSRSVTMTTQQFFYITQL